MESAPKRRAYHVPQGNPCAMCGLPFDRHYPSHLPSGYPNCKCGAPWENHKASAENYIAGIDGEGIGRDDHKYTLLAWSSESGKQAAHIEAKPGLALSTIECLNFILSVPKRAQLFAYAFGYDLTKILTDVDDSVIYLLMRPELRPNKSNNPWAGPQAVKWRDYRLNLIGSKFIVERGKRRVVIWDIFRFYQSKFTQALIDWKVADTAKLERMRDMKDRRADFDKQSPDEIRAYCYEECRYMAALAAKLIDAHNQAGLTLRSYFGAGSSAAAMLKQMGIDKEKRNGPKTMDLAVNSAFFGGRFEHSVIGEIPGPLYGLDISSAYPYQLWQLPCLACGTWEYTKDRNQIEGSQAALIRYGLTDAGQDLPWGPFPFRLKNGSIAFPATSGGGWIWKDEYLQGEKVFPQVFFREAWIYHTSCQHKPFAQVPSWYRERLRIGKEGPGIVLKLGLNSCYGKLAQSVGVDPPFRSAIWAGMVTSGTRAQMLELMGKHRDLSNLLMVATDGAYTREKLDIPMPINTDTAKIYGKDQDKPKPLGGWELKDIPDGMFAARPGIYFPLGLSPKELAKTIRARGVGRGSLVANWQRTLDAWKNGAESVKIAKVSRFIGAKSSISLRWEGKTPVFNRSSRYGQWEEKEIEMSFDPMPKRESINPDNTLEMRNFPEDLESQPYDNKTISPDALALKMQLMEILQQPDGDDYTDYETE